MKTLVAILFTSSLLLASYSASATLIDNSGYKAKDAATKSGKSYSSNKKYDGDDDKSDKDDDKKSYSSNKKYDGDDDKSDKDDDAKSYSSNKKYDGDDDKSDKDDDAKSYSSNKKYDGDDDKSDKNDDEKSYSSNKKYDGDDDKSDKDDDEKSYSSNKKYDGDDDKSDKDDDEKSYSSNKKYDGDDDKSDKDDDEKSYSSNKKYGGDDDKSDNKDDDNDKPEKIYGEKTNKIKIEDLYSDVKDHDYGKGGKVKIDGSDKHALSLSEAIKAQAGIFDDPSFNSDVSNILDMHFDEHGAEEGKDHKYASVTQGVLKSIKTKFKDGSLTSVKVKYSKGPKTSDKDELLAFAKGTVDISIYDTPTSIQSAKVALAVSEPSSIIIMLMGVILLVTRKKIAQIFRAKVA